MNKYKIFVPVREYSAGNFYAAQDLVRTGDLMKYGAIVVVLLFLFTAVVGLVYANIIF